MGELVVAGFTDRYRADEVLATLMRLQEGRLVELEDAAVVVRLGNGKVRLKQTQNLTAGGALSGGFWGMLLGLLFAAPLVGAVLGAGAGAIAGSIADVGIDDAFMREIGRTLAPESSAIFILVHDAKPNRLIEALTPFDAKIIRTSISREAEARLRAALERRDAAIGRGG